MCTYIPSEWNLGEYRSRCKQRFFPHSGLRLIFVFVYLYVPFFFCNEHAFLFQ